MEQPIIFTPAAAALIVLNAVVLVIGGGIGRLLRRYYVDAALLPMARFGLVLTAWQAPVLTGMLREGWTDPVGFDLAANWGVSAITELLIGGALGYRVAGRPKLSF